MSVSFYAGSLAPAMLGLLARPTDSVGRALAGLHDEYVQRKLLELDEIVRGAQFLGVPLRWS